MSPTKFVRPVAAITMVVIGVATVTAGLVVQRATAAAMGQPYCIQVSDGTSDYQPARSWFDLSALSMWAKRDGPLYMQHHAVLVVGDASNPHLYHWSYRNLTFEPGVLNGQTEGRGPVVTCLPKTDFATNLPLLISRPSDSDYVRYSAQEAYRIPRSWQSKWTGGTSRTLRLVTSAPDFLPLDRRWDSLDSLERDSNEIFIEWNPEWVLKSMTSPPRGTVVEETKEFGLSKTKTITHGKDGKDYVGYRYLAFADGRPEDANITMIGCSETSEAFPASCQHRFINKGRHFYFRHRPDDVVNWQRMQRRVVSLMASFEIGNDAHGADRR